jgi:peptide chain release factor 2
LSSRTSGSCTDERSTIVSATSSRGCRWPSPPSPFWARSSDKVESTINNQQSAIGNRQSAILPCLQPSTNSFAGIRTSPAAHPICGAIFDAARHAEELAGIERRVSEPDFWKDQSAAQKLLQRRRRLEEDRDLSESLRSRTEDLGVLAEWAEGGEPVLEELERGLDELSGVVDTGETKKMLGGEHDRKNAIVTIHPGAGGTESQDWAEMLLRMYLRWTERRGFKRDVIDLQPGDEAGIKSATVLIVGEYAYGLMLAEAGVHRLVRISPFDQASRRHTSFASVFVWPELPEDVDVEIDEKDLRVDTYRSSGAGGQHVNVTDSAVRVTHLPTGIVVSSQNERSQHRNRDSAMKVLRSRLFDVKMKEQQAKLDQLGGEKKDIAFGSQIRSYVLHPYQLIKDHRTKEEVGDVNRVLDGDIDVFIKSYLMKKASGTLGQAVADED